jgi:hypothetical protein
MYQEVGVTRELVRVGLVYLQLSMSYVMNTDQGYVTPFKLLKLLNFSVH